MKMIRIAALTCAAAMLCTACSTLNLNSDGDAWRESQCRERYGTPCIEQDRRTIEHDLRDVVPEPNDGQQFWT